MELGTSNESPITGSPRGGPWGHVLVAASACALTVSIVGSAVFLAHRAYTRYELQGKIRGFLLSIENRSTQELEERITQLEDRPKLVEQILPELAETLRRPRSEEQLCAAIRICKPFIKHKRIVEALMKARMDGRESVAAAAVTALAGLEPPERAAEVLGQCLDDSAGGLMGPAALDRACAGLFGLGREGLEVARKFVGKLSVDRRVWIVRYVNTVGGPHRAAWLELMAADADERVKLAVAEARAPAKQG